MTGIIVLSSSDSFCCVSYSKRQTLATYLTDWNTHNNILLAMSTRLSRKVIPRPSNLLLVLWRFSFHGNVGLLLEPPAFGLFETEKALGRENFRIEILNKFDTHYQKYFFIRDFVF